MWRRNTFIGVKLSKERPILLSASVKSAVACPNKRVNNLPNNSVLQTEYNLPLAAIWIIYSLINSFS